jgi:hypothetical protein
MVTRLSVRAAWSVGAAVLAWGLPAAAPAAVLRASEVLVILTSPLRCEASVSVTFDDPPPTIEHRLEVLDGATVTLAEIDGAAQVGEARVVGRTQALVLRPSASSYRLRYAVTQPEAGAFRCPVWLPTVPADGRSREVRVVATLPATAEPAGTMPTLRWSGNVGTAELGHLPAFVRLPYAAPGVTPPLNLVRLMDVAALAVLAMASLAWLRRRPAGRAATPAERR